MRLVGIYESAEDALPLALPLYDSLVPVGFPSPADDYIDLKLDLMCLAKKVWPSLLKKFGHLWLPLWFTWVYPLLCAA